ncbi:MAG: condensation domain-containing protein [Acidobacteriaceae bacterium]
MLTTADSIQDLTPQEEKHLLADLLGQAQEEMYPLSLAQQRIWFVEQFAPSTSAYNVPVGLRLKGRLDRFALASSLQQIVRRHAILRTTFRIRDDLPVQVVAAEGQVGLSLKDLREFSGEGRESEAWRTANEEASVPFNLATGPLLRVTLLQLDEEEHILLCVFHHIVCDAWSIAIFLRELAALYDGCCDGQLASLAELPIQYGDYAQWQQEWAASELLAQDLGYWKKKLEGIPELLELTDRERPLEQTHYGASQSVAVPDSVIDSLKALARSGQATLFMVMLAAFQVLVHAYSGSEDIVLGVPVAGRGRVELESLIGFFVNTVVLRADLTGDPPFTHLLSRVRETTLEAFAHAEVPFERLVEELKPRRSMSYSPIFQVMFSTIKDGRPPNFGPLATAPYVLSAGGSAFDLSVHLIEDATGHWWVTLEYNIALFDYDRIGKMLKHYGILLSAIAQQPSWTISKLISRMHAERDPVQGPAESAPARSGNGRIRYRSPLPKAPSNSGVSASDALEQILTRIWERTLDVPHLGVHDDFFDLGGHSLLAARLVAEVQKVIGRKVPLAALFRGPTVASFAELIRQGQESNPDPLLMQIKAGRRDVPLFAIAAPGVDALGYALLARHIGEQHSLFKIQAYAENGSDVPYTAEELEAIAHEYLTALRAFQPQGPYCFIATCGGVHIAERMVQMLEARGEEVGMFGIIDTWVVENRYVRWLARFDSMGRRLWEASRLPIHAQLSLYPRAIARRLRSIVQRDPHTTNPWDRAYYPAKDFRPKQFHAPVLLFKRRKQPYFCTRDPQMGWGLRSVTGVEIYPIDGAHEAMLREPAVQIIGESIAQALDRLRIQTPAGHQEHSRLTPVASPVTPYA